MLALTRKMDQRIQIGSDICITILHVRGKQVRLGIEAPRDVRVVRAELSNGSNLADNESAGRTISMSDLLAAVGSGSVGVKPSAPKRGPARRRPGSSNPGEHAFSSGRQPLAAKLNARRAPRTVPVTVS